MLSIVTPFARSSIHVYIIPLLIHCPFLYQPPQRYFVLCLVLSVLINTVSKARVFRHFPAGCSMHVSADHNPFILPAVHSYQTQTHGCNQNIVETTGKQSLTKIQHWKPSYLICFTIVLFPDSPAPKNRTLKRLVRHRTLHNLSFNRSKFINTWKSY